LLLLKEKVTAFGDIAGLFATGGELQFIHSIQSYSAEKLLWKMNPDREVAKKHLEECKAMLAMISIEQFNQETIKSAIWPYAETNGKGDVLWPLRMALTGQDKSPDPFMCAFILGRDEALKRIDVAIQMLGETV
jgi:glutamyl/glutaminyl-tRNA synthetase